MNTPEKTLATTLADAEESRLERLKAWKESAIGPAPNASAVGCLMSADRACMLMETWDEFVMDSVDVLNNPEVYRYAEAVHSFMAHVYSAMLAASSEREESEGVQPLWERPKPSPADASGERK